MKEQDFTPTGLKLEGSYENDRNQDSRELFQDIIREVYGVQDVIIGHHLVYQTQYVDDKGFTIQVVEEIPSADALIFDHNVMLKLFGELDAYRILQELALAPASDRDRVLSEYYYGRSKDNDELRLSATV